MKKRLRRNELKKSLIKVFCVSMFIPATMGVLGLVDDIKSDEITTTVPQQTTTQKVPETTQKVKKKKPKKVKLKRPVFAVEKRYEGKLKLSWKKIKKATYYKVYKKKKGGKYKFVVKTKRRAYIDKKVKKRKTYSYKVLAACKKSGKEYSSQFSKARTAYVRPARPVTVMVGECFVDGMKAFAKSRLPKNYKFVYKDGISTYGLMNTNFARYKKKTVTALERVAYYNPDRVVFLDGMNEATRYNTKSTIRNYKKMFKLLKSFKPNIDIVLLGLPPVGKHPKGNVPSRKNIAHYNKAYKKLANSLSYVYYYDGYRKLIMDKSGYLKVSGGDGVHWSPNGYVRAAKDIKKFCDKINKGE